MPGRAAGPPFEILEHTADIGLRARGGTLEEVFANAIDGLIEIVGARAGRGHDEESIATKLDEEDLGRTLVSFLNEVIYLIDRYHARIVNVAVERDGAFLVARVRWGSCAEPPDGTELKAATYHQLRVERGDQGYEATVYFDV